MACHAERDCQQCHNAMTKPLTIHPNDWISLHPLQARTSALECQSCHRLQSFCAACHARSGVADVAGVTTGHRVHADLSTWGTVDVAAGTSTLTPNHPCLQASRDLRSCMSCHREETCVRCHSQAAPTLVQRGITPHPNGFSATCRRAARANDRGCLVCHSEADLSARGCR
jgi:hypothetical protein